MKRKMLFGVVFVVLFFWGLAVVAQQPLEAPIISDSGAPKDDLTLTNDGVIALVQAGVGQDLILAKIRSSRVRFDTSVSAIVILKKAGVSDPVIQAMMDADMRRAGENFNSFASAMAGLDGPVFIEPPRSNDPNQYNGDQGGYADNSNTISNGRRILDSSYDQRRARERAQMIGSYGGYAGGYGGIGYPAGYGYPGAYGRNTSTAYNGPIFSSSDPAAVLGNEIRSELFVAVRMNKGQVTTNQNAPYRLISHYSISNEEVTNKGWDAASVAVPGLYARGYYRQDVWTWLLLVASQVHRDEQRRIVQGILYLDLVDRNGMILYSTVGSNGPISKETLKKLVGPDEAEALALKKKNVYYGTVDKLESKSVQYGPYYNERTRFTNAHYLAQAMVVSAVADTGL